MKQITAAIRSLSLSFIFVIFAFNCSGQQDKKISLSASGHFDFGLNQFQSIDDAGFGISVKAMYAASKRAAVGAETSADWFLGDKLYFENGKNNKPAIYSLRMGSQLFVSKRFHFTLLYGVARYVLRETDYMTAGTYKLGANMLLGKKENFNAGFFYVGVSRSPKHLTHFGISLGYRIF